MEHRSRNLESPAIVLYYIVLCCIVLHCIVLYSFVLYCIVMYCVVLHCIVLYCTVLYCIVSIKADLVSFCCVVCAANTAFYGFICWFSLLY